jgi:hypothetical protein
MTLYQRVVQSGENGGGGATSEAERWQQAPAPAQVAKRILEGVFDTGVAADRIPLLTNAMHWLYGTVAGSVYGVVQGTIRANPVAHGLVFGGAVWGFSYAQLAPMGIYEPPWRYSARPKCGAARAYASDQGGACRWVGADAGPLLRRSRRSAPSTVRLSRSGERR